MRKFLIFTLLFLFLSIPAFAGDVITKDLSSGNSFSNPLTPVEVDDWRVKSATHTNISITGTWSGTITLQRKFSDEASWTSPSHDVRTYTSNTENHILEGELNVQYRIGFKTGDYNSGTATVRLSK